MERPPAGQRFVQHDTQAEDVAAAIDPDPLAAGLFGTHVRRHAAGAGPLADILLAQGQPEVGAVRLAVLVEQGVAGLDVAMHQALLVGQMQGLGTVVTSSTVCRAEGAAPA